MLLVPEICDLERDCMIWTQVLERCATGEEDAQYGVDLKEGMLHD